MPGQIMHGIRVMVTTGPHHRAVAVSTLAAKRSDVRIVLRRAVTTGEGLIREVSQVGDQRLGRKWLARVVRGAMRLTTTAFGARVQIEGVLPREVLERAGAEVLIRLVLRVHHRV